VRQQLSGLAFGWPNVLDALSGSPRRVTICALRYNGKRTEGAVVETRKLVAILAADVVGYRRLAGSDEDRTLARLRALRSDLIDPTIAVHNGRVVKRTGDGSIVEFRSVVDAVRCAIEVQNSMVERNARLPPERRLFPKVQRASRNSCRARRTVLLIRSDRSVAPFGGLSARTETCATPQLNSSGRTGSGAKAMPSSCSSSASFGVASPAVPRDPWFRVPHAYGPFCGF